MVLQLEIIARYKQNHVDVEGDEEGGEAGDGDHVQYSGVVGKEKQPILTFES